MAVWVRGRLPKLDGPISLLEDDPRLELFSLGSCYTYTRFHEPGGLHNSPGTDHGAGPGPQAARAAPARSEISHFSSDPAAFFLL